MNIWQEFLKDPVIFFSFTGLALVIGYNLFLKPILPPPTGQRTETVEPVAPPPARGLPRLRGRGYVAVHPARPQHLIG